jgi:hypothetical protein
MANSTYGAKELNKKYSEGNGENDDHPALRHIVIIRI